MKCNLCSDEADINILLYLGFVLVAVGVIITSVGLGDRGFRTLELRMVGPLLLLSLLLLLRESKQPNGCFSLRWTQYITASERVDVAPISLSSLLNSLELYLELSFS